MKTDYKFWYITREDDVHISEVAVRFREGEETTLNERTIMGGLFPILRYRPNRRLQREELTHLGDKFKKDLAGNDSKLYHPSEFGIIKTDDELRLFVNNEIAKDKTRTVITEQSELLDIGKVR